MKRRKYEDKQIQEVIKKARTCVDSLCVNIFGIGTPKYDPRDVFKGKAWEHTEGRRIKSLTREQYEIMTDFLKLARYKDFSMRQQTHWEQDNRIEADKKQMELNASAFNKWRGESQRKYLISKFKEWLKLTDEEAKKEYEFSLLKFLSIKAGRGVGKTYLQALMDLSFFVLYPNSKITIIGPSGRQVQDSIWSEMSAVIRDSEMVHRHHSIFYGADLEKKHLDDRYKGHKMIVKTSQRIYFEAGNADWFIGTANIDSSRDIKSQVEQLSGRHQDHMLFSLEEASNISDKIFWTLLNSCKNSQVNFVTAAFNPNRNRGFAIESAQGEYAIPTDNYKGIAKGYRINSLNCLLINPEDIEKAKEMYGGEDSNEFRISFLGLEPLNHQTSTFFSSATIDDAEIGYSENIDLLDEERFPRIITMDVSAQGDDKCVLAYWCGNFLVELHEIDKSIQRDDQTLVNQMVEYIVKKRAIKIIYESNGVGSYLGGRLRTTLAEYNRSIPYGVEESRINCNICPVNVGNSVKSSYGKDHKKYSRLGDMMYGRFKHALEDREIFINPVGSMNKSQLRNMDKIQLRKMGGDINKLIKQSERFDLLRKQMLLARPKSLNDKIDKGGSNVGKLQMDSFKTNAGLKKMLRQETGMASPDHLDAVKLWFLTSLETEYKNMNRENNLNHSQTEYVRIGMYRSPEINGNIQLC